MTAVLLIGACGSGGGGDGSAESARVDLRSDGIFRSCGGEAPSARNPFGLTNQQWESEEANRELIRNTGSRGAAIQQATGKPVRIVFHQPGGWFASASVGMPGALPTVAVMNGRKQDGSALYPWRWQVWAEEVQALADAHPDWILGVYFSGQVPAASAQDAVDASQAFETYDHENTRHRSLVLGVVDQWSAVGVREFLLDSTSQPDNFVGIPQLADAVHGKGGRLFIEAHPQDGGGGLGLSMLGRVDGSLASHRHMVLQEPASRAWVVPEGVVMFVALTDHSIPGRLSSTTPTSGDVQSYRERGFVLLSGNIGFDEFLTE